MNRLQKKCFIAATGFHGLLVMILLVGPAFLTSHSKIDDSQVIDFIPANLIDGDFHGGGPKNPTPPAADPQPVAPEPQPQPQPQQRAEVTQPKPPEVPKVDPVKPVPPTLVKDVPKAEPDKDSFAEKKKPAPQVSLKLVTRKDTTADAAKAKAKADAAAAAADARTRATAISRSARNLRQGLSSTTEVETPAGFGGGGEAYANYALVVKSIYDKSWIEPSDSTADEAVAKATITISSDGTVISARISQSSGDTQVDASVQRTLDRVKYIAPFPAGTKDKERSYIINFNLKAKRLSA